MKRRTLEGARLAIGRHPLCIGAAPLKLRPRRSSATLCRRHPLCIGAAPLKPRIASVSAVATMRSSALHWSGPIEACRAPADAAWPATRHPLCIGAAPLKRDHRLFDLCDRDGHPLCIGAAPLKPHLTHPCMPPNSGHPLCIGAAPLKRPLPARAVSMPGESSALHWSGPIEAVGAGLHRRPVRSVIRSALERPH